MQKLISKSEKIFIAGSRGMVGQAVIKALRKSGYGEEENGGIMLKPPKKELNLLNLHEVENWFLINKPSVVILAAAKVGGIFANNAYSADFILENLKIQNNVIEMSYKYGVKRFLFLGSSCIYPKYASQPISEECLLTGALEPTNQWYAIAKIAGLKLCEALRKQHNFDAICLMPTNLYGPGDNYNLENSHVMAALIRKFLEAKKNNLPFVKCWGTGNPKREFMHVDDLGQAVVHVLENWDPESPSAPKDEFGNKLYHLNVGTGKDISIRELSEKISKITNYNGRIEWDNSKPDGTPLKKLNINKIKEIGWNPLVNLEEGILKTIESINNTKPFLL